MPTVATVAVTNDNGDELEFFSRTRRGDLIRLCFADSAEARPYPYERAPFRSFEREHTFEWFRQDGTLYLASGYAFVAYGAGSFFERVVSTHMRRHYFQMGLLASFELATLLTFSTRISRAVAQYEPRSVSAEQFEDWMQAIEDEFLQFMHRFRFTGVSNHVQGQKLFDLWRRHLRLKEIFDHLNAEITSATQYLFNRAASRSAQTTARLSAIATIGLIGGLTFSLLGMNVLASQDIVAALTRGRLLFHFAIVVWTLAAFTWLGLASFRWVSTLTESPSARPRSTAVPTFDQRFRHMLWIGGVTLTVLSLALLLGLTVLDRAVFHPAPALPPARTVELPGAS
jgi:hypothetical protein